MKKKWMTITVLLLVFALGAYFAVSSRGEVLEDGSIELLPPQVVYNRAGTSTSSTGTFAPFPRGKTVRINKGFLGVVSVQQVPSGFGNNLDIYFQSSTDNGLTWVDFAHVFVSSNTGTYLVPISLGPDLAWPTTVGSSPPPDGTMGAGIAAATYGIGERIRIKYSAAFGASSTGSFVFHATAFPK
jgi:hypothetical protein